MNTLKLKPPSLFSIPNIRRFVFFRLFFNARFYYPVFSILFLDFGLTLPQFAVLNAVWAATIVLLEVPSGAMADTIGRKKLLVASSAIMVVEMGVLLLAPRSNPNLLFTVFVINRILSGAAEALASGADEALAYDSLKAKGQESQWGRVLEAAMRIQSIGFMVTMTIGAAAYDPNLMTWLFQKLGFGFTATQSTTLRLPILLTFFMAASALMTTLGMREVPDADSVECTTGKACRKSILESFRLTVTAGRWILQTPFALVIIASGFLFDGMVRMAITMTSQYYRLIRLPEASFGIIGSAISLLGLFIPRWAMQMTKHRLPSSNGVIAAAVIFASFLGMTFFLPYWGLLPVVGLFAAMTLTGFFTSHYLNRITPSSHRATVLSFKGLSFNLAYGSVGLLYSFLLSTLRKGIEGHGEVMAEEALINAVFIKSIIFFPLFFVPAATGLFFWAWFALRGGDDHRHVG